jgi:hypothetical protein
MLRVALPLAAVAAISACKEQKTAGPETAALPDARASLPRGVAPFASISTSDLAPHRRVAWLLSVISSPPDSMRTWEISETRAGDVPMPANWIWKCRFGPVVVSKDVGEGSEQHSQNREVRCSNDNWATWAGDTAQFWPLQAPTSGNVETDVAGAGKAYALVTLQPCVSGCVSATQLP